MDIHEIEKQLLQAIRVISAGRLDAIDTWPDPRTAINIVSGFEIDNHGFHDTEAQKRLTSLQRQCKQFIASTPTTPFAHYVEDPTWNALRANATQILSDINDRQTNDGFLSAPGSTYESQRKVVAAIWPTRGLAVTILLLIVGLTLVSRSQVILGVGISAYVLVPWIASMWVAGTTPPARSLASLSVLSQKITWLFRYSAAVATMIAGAVIGYDVQSNFESAAKNRRNIDDVMHATIYEPMGQILTFGFILTTYLAWWGLLRAGPARRKVGISRCISQIERATGRLPKVLRHWLHDFLDTASNPWSSLLVVYLAPIVVILVGATITGLGGPMMRLW
ncbi:hypothetical protein [Luteipulveratus halotolerans]|uniref:hypothetical protein n=1 Tax=Luteipulveratus halotolerans TaxID=1631356 RepID=UPI0012F71B3A|nr:hypothetical protein [Luteipulveratus halotolerans]